MERINQNQKPLRSQRSNMMNQARLKVLKARDDMIAVSDQVLLSHFGVSCNTEMSFI